MAKRNRKITSNRIIFSGFFVGLIITFLAWVVSMLAGGYGFSWEAIKSMHIKTPGFFVIDLIPFITAYAFYWFYSNTEQIRTRLESTIAQMQELIRRNLDIARQISEGNLDFDIEVKPDDQLGQALLLMRDNLRATYQREAELGWITKGKEIISDILRYHNDLDKLAYETIVSIVNYTDAIQGVFYIYDEDKNLLVNRATYAYNRRRYISQEFKIGQGLVGQCAYERDIIYRKEIPEDYFTISSGLLGDKKPKTLLLAPLIGDDKLQGVIELASFDEDIPQRVIQLIEEVSGVIGQTIFNLKINIRTEQLLREYRQMTELLKKNEEQLRKQAEEMRKAQEELEKVNIRLANEIAEVERTRKRLYALLENASEVIFIYNQDGIITYISPSIKHILGYDPDELIGKNGFEIFTPEVNEILRKAFMRLLSNPSEPVTMEYLFKKEGDNEMWLETTGRNLLDNTAINGIIFNTRDISVRKIAERAQRMSGQMRALSENSPDMIIRASRDGKIYYANPVAEVFLKVGRRYIIGNNIEKLDIHPEVKEIFLNSMKRVIENQKKLQFETTFPIKGEEEPRVVLFNVIPEFNEVNELESVLFVAHDITEQKKIQIEIEKKNKSITESINYARRIQSAIIPDIKTIRQYLPKSFMFYLPRDVVSGDIPWFFVKDNYVYIAAVDCTGHGVPGALLSFIGYFLLNNIVSTQPELSAGEILDMLHAQVRKTLRQDTPDAEARDGMDIALCKIDFNKNKMSFSGAHRPLYYLKRNGEFIQYKGTLKAVGGIPRRNRIEPSFSNYDIEFAPGDKFFIFTDGLADQVSEKTKEKFKNKRIRQLINENKDATIMELHEILKKTFFEWKGNHKQIDDVLFIGVEF